MREDHRLSLDPTGKARPNAHKIHLWQPHTVAHLAKPDFGASRAAGKSPSGLAHVATRHTVTGGSVPNEGCRFRSPLTESCRDSLEDQ